MTQQPLWKPTAEAIDSTRMRAFCSRLEHKLGLTFKDYSQLHQWSIEHPEQFWEQVWHFTDIQASQPYTQVLNHGDQFPGARWFDGARFNFAENLLRNRSDKPALIARLENGTRRTLSYRQLYQQVAQVSAALRRAGITRGDRVAGFMPNIPETVIAMLATASIGAIWSSCSPDFGLNGIVDRFGQIAPKALFACDGYYYNGKTIKSLPQVKGIADKIDSIQILVMASITNKPDISGTRHAVHWEDWLSEESATELVFEQLPFDHPLYIMYSSGTTGVPKCIVHSAGGTLIQHLKEHQLHLDLQPRDVLFYFTTCGWMMWNWLVSGLASEATLVLYDGSPAYPSVNTLLDMIDAEHISVFGTSAKYLATLQKSGLKPRDSHQLSSLRSILSTGSPLSHEGFHYVYRDIKTDVCLSSISGGTDIISCFVLGNTCLPVRAGEIQCPGLGMAVEFRDEGGRSLQGEKGELACTRPFPSAPIGFWNDPDGNKYRATYFSRYPSQNGRGIWAHGDYGEMTEHGGVIIYGRSDAVLNPGGVRIGTAEIYRQVEKIPEVVDSVCIGQEWDNDVRVILLVVLQQGTVLEEGLQATIRTTIRQNTSPRHVPAKIIAVSDIPRTISGKIAELAVRDVIHNKPVNNTDALANPEALELFRDLPELLGG